MGLFSRSKPAPEIRVPAAEEVAAAGRAIARGNDKPAKRLLDEAGPYAQAVGLEIFSASLDYTPDDEGRR